MYPELYTLSFGDTNVPIMTFGVCLTIAFGLFYWMLSRLGRKYQISTSFLTINLLLFFLVTFFASRLAHVLLYMWLPTKSAFSIEYPVLSFFLMSDFYFSLSGALIGFFGVFLYLFRHRDEVERDDARDILVIAWLFAAIVGYLGAFFGGQTYGIRSDGIFAIDYTNNPVLAEFPRFPLALLYSIFCIFIFSLCYIVKKLRPERGLAAGAGALLWWLVWFVGEWWNDASSDNIAYLFGWLQDFHLMNCNQWLSLFLIAWWSYKLATIIPSPLSDWILDVADRIMATQTRARKYLKKLFKKIRR